MNSYETLSEYYDRFTDDVGYEEWADFFERLFEKEGVKPELVLDLACGTGSLTRILAQRGYDMIGADASPEMLMQALQNTLDCEPRPLLLNQRMEELDLYGAVDACLCCLDSVNYVTEPEALQTAFERVHTFLNPDGLFVFDINTPEKFARIDGESYVREDDGVFCVWQAAVEDGLVRLPVRYFRAGGRCVAPCAGNARGAHLRACTADRHAGAGRLYRDQNLWRPVLCARTGRRGPHLLYSTKERLTYERYVTSRDRP